MEPNYALIVCFSACDNGFLEPAPHAYSPDSLMSAVSTIVPVTIAVLLPVEVTTIIAIVMIP